MASRPPWITFQDSVARTQFVSEMGSREFIASSSSVHDIVDAGVNAPINEGT